ncbi:MAG: DUF1343 domain-containing protein [Deltaproteobacteria bacterium]|jgi:uncharacterized protein YbbC (DUF1343 family)|nr:DUF1343 domain-containing protein [Deltaproteobacteria bacterium]
MSSFQKPVVTGLAAVVADPSLLGSVGSVGLLANQASVDLHYRSALELLDEVRPGLVKRVFSPQHGYGGEKQDNMIESAHGAVSDGRALYSLYGDKRKPSPEMLQGLEALLVDLVDVGTRVYTFAQTTALCLEACGEAGVQVIVLDRPNPVGGLEVEGNVLDDDCVSFVGLHPVPMRHSLTIGELALFVNARLAKPAKLTVIPLRGWNRSMHFQDTALNWVMPSPNMPVPETASVYPGQVIWEGTNISEGRGTTRPFNLMGAPFIEPGILYRDLLSFDLPGLALRPATFEPTFHKWSGQVCGGAELYPTDKSFKPFLTALTVMEIIFRRWPGALQLKEPPYEYEFVRRPIDLILGRSSIFDALRDGEKAADICRSFEKELADFVRETKTIRLY